LLKNTDQSSKTAETGSFYIRDLLNNDVHEVSKEAATDEDNDFNASVERIDGVDVNEFRKFDAKDEEITALENKDEGNLEADTESVDMINPKEHEVNQNEAAHIESNNVILADQNNSIPAIVSHTRQDEGKVIPSTSSNHVDPRQLFEGDQPSAFFPPPLTRSEQNISQYPDQYSHIYNPYHHQALSAWGGMYPHAYNNWNLYNGGMYPAGYSQYPPPPPPYQHNFFNSPFLPNFQQGPSATPRPVNASFQPKVLYQDTDNLANVGQQEPSVDNARKITINEEEIEIGPAYDKTNEVMDTNPCTECNLTFESKAGLLRHYLRDHNKKQVEIDNSSAGRQDTKDENLLNRDSNTLEIRGENSECEDFATCDTSQGEYLCCEKNFDEQGFLVHCVKTHVRAEMHFHLGDSYKERKGECFHCDGKFSDLQKYAEHIGSDHRLVRDYLVVMPRFERYRERLMAMKVEPMPQYNTRNKSRFNKIVESPESAKAKSKAPYNNAVKILLDCPLCDKQLSNRTWLLRHIVDIHYYQQLTTRLQQDFDDDNKCDCNADMSTIRAFIRHTAINHEVLLEICTPEVAKLLRSTPPSKNDVACNSDRNNFKLQSSVQSNQPHTIYRRSNLAANSKNKEKERIVLKKDENKVSKPLTDQELMLAEGGRANLTKRRGFQFRCQVCKLFFNRGYKQFLSHVGSAHHREELMKEFGPQPQSMNDLFQCKICGLEITGSNFFYHYGARHEGVLKYATWIVPPSRDSGAGTTSEDSSHDDVFTANTGKKSIGSGNESMDVSEDDFTEDQVDSTVDDERNVAKADPLHQMEYEIMSVQEQEDRKDPDYVAGAPI